MEINKHQTLNRLSTQDQTFLKGLKEKKGIKMLKMSQNDSKLLRTRLISIIAAFYRFCCGCCYHCCCFLLLFELWLY